MKYTPRTLVALSSILVAVPAAVLVYAHAYHIPLLFRPISQSSPSPVDQFATTSRPAENVAATKTATTTAVLIEFQTAPTATELALVRSYNGIITRTFHIIPAVAAKIPNENVAKLRAEKSIKIVEADQNAFKRATDASTTENIAIFGSTTPPHGTIVPKNNVTVAIIDTGIDYTHSYLKANYAGGYNFITNTSDPMDDNGHGTHVAGIILHVIRQHAEQFTSVPMVKLYALKTLGADGMGLFSNIIAALEWSVDHHIDVVNNSYGTLTNPGIIVAEAFDNAYKAGLLDIAAAGNSGHCDGDTDTVEFPGRYASVVTVGAINEKTNVRPCFSSTGKDVEIVAPGVLIFSTDKGGTYSTHSGTSMAAPYVTGVAALLLNANASAAHGSTTNETVRSILQQTAHSIYGQTRNPWYGFGLVDVEKALELWIKS